MADASTPQASALVQPQFWTLDRVADALRSGPRGATAITRIARIKIWRSRENPLFIRCAASKNIIAAHFTCRRR